METTTFPAAMLSAVLEAELGDGKLDAAILATPASDARLGEIPLYDEPFWVAVPNAHLGP